LSGFIVACAALVLFSGVFYLFPRRREGVDEDQARANLDWYRLREEEIARDGDEALRDDARLRLLEDDQQSAAAGASHEAVSRGSFPVWILLPLIAVASASLYYLLGAAPDVAITRQLEQIDESSSEQDMAQLIDAIEKRSAQRPDNLNYIALLGRYYMGQQDYGRAASTYSALVEDAPEDAQALAYAAQAEYLAAGRSLSDSARMKAEQALAVNPHQRTALGLLGMASFEQGQYRAAIEYWQRLLAMETPGSESANMIAGVIQSAQQKLGEAPAVASASPAPVAADPAGAGVTVTVSGGDGINPGDTVFILARNAQSESRMPIAVRRMQGAQLPLTLRLDDSNSMAGQKLSETESVMVVVQVSPSGQPGAANATWTGQAGPLAPSLDGEAIAITLQPRG
jgi:cytochrome c-type biogenesis protein CcmH